MEKIKYGEDYNYYGNKLKLMIQEQESILERGLKSFGENIFGLVLNLDAEIKKEKFDKLTNINKILKKEVDSFCNKIMLELKPLLDKKEDSFYEAGNLVIFEIIRFFTSLIKRGCCLCCDILVEVKKLKNEEDDDKYY